MRSNAQRRGRARIPRTAAACLTLALASLTQASAWGATTSLQARICAGDPTAPASFVASDDLLDHRPDLRAARARTEAAARQVELAHAAEAQRLEVGGKLGIASRGLNNMVHTGSDMGQAALGVWSPPAEPRAATPLQLARAELQAAAVAYAWALTQAHREVAAAVAQVQLIDRRLARHAASVADAEAAQAALRQARADESDLARSLAEIAVRRGRLAAEQARSQTARAALAAAIGCPDRQGGG